MATVNKDFKVKNGLIVEGTTGTINNYDILTKDPDDQTYIVGLIGGSADSANTPNTVVKRDGSGNFAAGTITADLTGDVTGDVTGTVSSLSNHNTDDLSEGTTNKYYTDGRVKNVLTNSTQTNISITEIGGQLHITAENGVADSTTDDLTEGTTNKYFTEARVRDALNGGSGITFNGSTGDISADVAGGLHIGPTDQVEIDRSIVDGWYDANGAAQDVQDNLDTHTNATSAHGVTGNIVGTSDTQTLTNKTIGDVLTFNDGSNNSTIDVVGNDLTITANADLTIASDNGDIVLAAAMGNAYVGSVSAGNTIATNSYVDNAVSGLDWKQAVNLLATSNVILQGQQQITIDGHAVGSQQIGYRILVTAQDYASQNGIYTVTDGGQGTILLARTVDADTYQELVGAAVFVMEGTQYNNTSWVQSNHYLTDFTGQSWTQFSGTGSVVAGTGITVDGLEVSVDRTTVDTWYDAAGTAATEVGSHNLNTSGVHGVIGDVVGTSDSQTLNNKTLDFGMLGGNTAYNIPNEALVNNSITINGSATALGSSVTLDTDDVSEGTSNKYYTDQRVRDVLTGSTQTNISISEVSGQLIITAENGVADSTTDDLDEGVFNHYFTDERAKAAAINLLTNATTQNITIQQLGMDGLSITAENGVADSTTDDLDEGTTNLYFTDQRAVSALENVVPNFTEVDINSLATQVAATTGNVATASTVTAYQFAKADYRSAKFLVKCAYGSHTELAEVLLTLDSSDNIAITEYAIVGTNGSSMTISADVSTVVMANDTVRLRVTTINNNSTVNVVGTLLA